MTSTQAVKNEIERFLRTTDAEVLCVTGSWGVGKTYTWQTILDRVRGKRETGLSRYSYVSLFGIDSLEGMKTAIFENMEFLLPEGGTGIERFLSGGKQLASAVAALPVPYLGGALSKAQPLLFSAIRNQIVCVDDLERRGAISVKDVFGLVSYLREQRACKVVLLLNRTQLDDAGQKQFDEFFEKVIDTHLVFAPNSSEALAIAISERDHLSGLIRGHCEKLDISNIRVIKKIERLVRMLDEPILSKFTPDVVRQVVHSVVMFGWRKLDVGAKPPPASYLQQGEFARYISKHNEMEEESDEGDDADRQRWDIVLAGYGWGSMDELDGALLSFVESGILDTDVISAKAKDVEASLSHRNQMAAFEQCWRPFHDSFSDNEDEVCREIVQGVKDNFAIVSRPNLDAAVTILQELGRSVEADALIDFAKENGSNEFWASDDPFHRGVKDSRIRHLVEERRVATKPSFDFEKDLLSAMQSNSEKLALLAAVPVEQYQRLFECSTGTVLNDYIYAALEHRTIGNATDDMRKLVAKVEEALRRIARTSKLNEIRVRKYNINLDSPEGGCTAD